MTAKSRRRALPLFQGNTRPSKADEETLPQKVPLGNHDDIIALKKAWTRSMPPSGALRMMPGAARQLAIEHIFEDHLTYSFGGGKRGVGSRRSEAPNQESVRPYNRRIVLETIRLHGADRPRRDRPQGRPDRLDHHPRARTTGTSSSAPARFPRAVAILQRPSPSIRKAALPSAPMCRRSASSSASRAGGHPTSFEIYKCVSSPRCIRRTVFTVTSFPLGVLRQPRWGEAQRACIPPD